MKKLFSSMRFLCLLLLAFVTMSCFASCGGKGQGEVLHAEEGMLVISAEEVEEGATLKSVMQAMQEEGEITFTEDGNGLILSINGYSKTGEYWFLYTSCTDYATDAWGKTTYDGKEYASATLGYESLPAVKGEIYIWKSAAW